VRLARTMVGLAVGVMGAATACCGGSASNQSTSSTAASINASADRATANAVNLTAADLPGWKQSANTTTSADRSMTARLAKCAGAQDPARIDVVDIDSPNFDQGPTEVSSEVTTVRTHADGLTDLKALESAKLDPCVQQIAVPQLKADLPSGATITTLKISTFTPLSQPPDSFALRIDVTVSIPQQGSVVLNSDEIGFLKGRAEVELDASQTGGGSPSATLEQRLTSILVSRAQRQST
jgi:hypothetical protein